MVLMADRAGGSLAGNDALLRKLAVILALRKPENRPR